MNRKVVFHWPVIQHVWLIKETLLLCNMCVHWVQSYHTHSTLGTTSKVDPAFCKPLDQYLLPHLIVCQLTKFQIFYSLQEERYVGIYPLYVCMWICLYICLYTVSVRNMYVWKIQHGIMLIAIFIEYCMFIHTSFLVILLEPFTYLNWITKLFPFSMARPSANDHAIRFISSHRTLILAISNVVHVLFLENL